MQVVFTRGDDDLARVFAGRLDDGAHVEFVESVEPPHPREEKWVLIVSTLRGCPIGCPICDAGGHYRGKLGADEILGQIDYLVRRRFPDGRVPTRKLKIQFARMGDPALNDAVLEVLEVLAERDGMPGLMPCISTIAPAGRDRFFEDLLRIKRERYGGGRFQMQFSVHGTDDLSRRAMVPARTWSLERMAAFGNRFHEPSDRKITLNFAPPRGARLDPGRLAPLFSPERFLVKLTPINPTVAARSAGIEGLIDPDDPETGRAVARRFEELGYETILSIGETAENEIGSNCGMYAARAMAAEGYSKSSR